MNLMTASKNDSRVLRRHAGRLKRPCQHSVELRPIHRWGPVQQANELIGRLARWAFVVCRPESNIQILRHTLYLFWSFQGIDHGASETEVLDDLLPELQLDVLPRWSQTKVLFPDHLC